MVEFRNKVSHYERHISKETTLEEAASLLLGQKFTLLPITDENGILQGVFTRRNMLQMLMDQASLTTPIRNYIKEQVVTVNIETPFEEINEIAKTSTVGTVVVVDQNHRVMGLFSKTDMVLSLFESTPELERMASELETVKRLKTTLQTTLDYAYDGIVTIDEGFKIQMVSPSLLQLFQLQEEEVLGRLLSEAIPQLQLAHVFQTREADFSNFEEVQGIKYIVHRIPIIQDGKVIGAIGKVMFRQLNEVGQLFKKWQQAVSKADFYEKQYKQADAAKYTWEQIYSVDPHMDKLKKNAGKAAKGRSTIMIRGESGTGKELFAHAIHSSSARRDDPFVIVNCAAIPEDLLESEFFGYEEGAFTGARQRGKIGKFDLANGGTLFLDEIGDMSLSLQAKLLRVLQDREFYRVGGTSRVLVDVRIIAATNRDLEQMIAEGQFRGDLYYRLNVISLYIPPLRERQADIDYLIVHLMEELNRVLATSVMDVEKSVKEILFSYDWPGNVRELKNVLERAMTFAEHRAIQIEDLPDYLLKQIAYKQSENQESTMFENAEIHTIKKALLQTKGNKAEAARLLGISRSSLYEKLKKYQIV